MDVAQYRLDKIARLSRGEKKEPAAVSIEPSPLPAEAFAETAKEALESSETAAAPAPAAPTFEKPATSWAPVRTGENAEGED